MQQGFHLIELLIALTIVSILATISLPIYSQHIAHTRRLEAETKLSALAIAMETYFVTHNSYQGATLAKLHIAKSIANDRYELSIASATPLHYVLMAKPLGDQATNDLCGALTLNDQEEKRVMGQDRLENCW